MGSKRRKHPSQAELHEWFFYDPDTGFLHWKMRPNNNVMWGGQAGASPNKVSGYLEIKFKGVRFKQHNFVWIMHNGDIPDGVTIDHKNKDKADNRLANLRLATPRQQSIHQRSKGFRRDIRHTINPWQSQHRVDGLLKSIGNFPTALHARLAYERRVHELEPEFASQVFTQWVDRLIKEGVTS